MVKNIREKLISLLLLSVFVFVGCFTGQNKSSNKNSININSIKTYRDIPDITEDEIAAVEALKSSGAVFLTAVLLQQSRLFCLTEHIRALHPCSVSS